MKKIAKIVKTVKKISQFQGKKAKKGWITPDKAGVWWAEKTAFENSGEKNANLVKLNAALLNLPPTSVSCERVFSVSGNFGNKQRARLSDDSLDSLVFLKYYFK